MIMQMMIIITTMMIMIVIMILIVVMEIRLQILMTIMSIGIGGPLGGHWRVGLLFVLGIEAFQTLVLM